MSDPFPIDATLKRIRRAGLFLRMECTPQGLWQVILSDPWGTQHVRLSQNLHEALDGAFEAHDAC